MQWSDYAQIKSAYDKVRPYHTTRQELEQMGFNPHKQANIKIENFSSIQRRFDPNFTFKNLPPAISKCVRAGNACTAYYIDIKQTTSARIGNLVLDTLNFKRITHTKGWHFQALYVMENDLVVFKLWNGSPNIAEYKTNYNPLGPLQDGVTVGVGLSYNINN
jgi:hypothetical protein